MPTQALVRYLDKPKVQALIKDLGMESKLVVEGHGKHSLVHCGVAELEPAERDARAEALQKICDADAKMLPKQKNPAKPAKVKSRIASSDGA